MKNFIKENFIAIIFFAILMGFAIYQVYDFDTEIVITYHAFQNRDKETYINVLQVELLQVLQTL